MTKIKESTTVQAPVELVYQAWHNFENFPRFMDNIDEVRVVSGGRSHWRAKGPLGSPAEWNAEMTLDESNRAIGWRSIEGSKVKTAGRVNFYTEDDTTRIEVTIEYEAPAGVAGDLIAKIFSNPERQVKEDLQRFKEAIERGREASGLRFGNGTGEALGASMGANTGEDLERIERSGAGVSPGGVDDPATR